MKEMICIVCPVGCHMTIDSNMNVFNNKCKRGEVYAKKELTNPTRVVTSTVRIESNLQRRVPVKTLEPIPKEKIFDLMALLQDVTLKAPVHRGDVVLKNVFDTGIDVVCTMQLEE
jgi:CxxC motif-containing protein